MINLNRVNNSKISVYQKNNSKNSTINENSKSNIDEEINNPKSSENKRQIDKLKAREKEVIAHEQAHKSAGGKFAGAMSYSYTTGPDGRRYVSGGEVNISIPGGEASEKLIQDLRQVKRAALAPANPSGQDMSVASSADSKIQKVRSALNKKYMNSKEQPKSKIDLLV